MSKCNYCEKIFSKEKYEQNRINTSKKVNIFQCPNCFYIEGKEELIPRNEDSRIFLTVSKTFIKHFKKLYIRVHNVINNYIYSCGSFTKHENTISLLEEYYKWLNILAENNGAHIVSPSTVIDQVWHLHILDTHDYRKVCKKICGHIIDHYPENSFSNQKNDKIDRYYNTVSFYEKKYGKIHYDNYEFWVLKDNVRKVHDKKKTGDVTIRTVTGKIFQLPYHKDMVVLDLATMIEEKIGTPIVKQRIIYDGRQFEIGMNNLHDIYNVNEGDIINVMFRMKGC